jgi:hypothetical protein
MCHYHHQFIRAVVPNNSTQVKNKFLAFIVEFFNFQFNFKRGVYVDGVTEESIHNPEDAYKLFEQGAANRHISATAMNRESSRSHTVFKD